MPVPIITQLFRTEMPIGGSGMGTSSIITPAAMSITPSDCSPVFRTKSMPPSADTAVSPGESPTGTVAVTTGDPVRSTIVTASALRSETKSVSLFAEKDAMVGKSPTGTTASTLHVAVSTIVIVSSKLSQVTRRAPSLLRTIPLGCE